MRTIITVLLLISAFTSEAEAQRDPPVWDSYLPRTVVYSQRLTLDFEATWNKGGGPVEQSSHAQMYVLLYLEKDENEIMELSKSEKLTNKKESVNDSILSTLEERKLAIVLDTKVATLEKSDLTKKLKRKMEKGFNYDFEFSFDYSKLLEKYKGLANFDKKSVRDAASLGQYFDDKVKLLIVVPVNDSPLATLIPDKLKNSYDFAHLMNYETSIHYFKPLPQRYKLRQLKDGKVVAAID